MKSAKQRVLGLSLLQLMGVLAIIGIVAWLLLNHFAPVT